MPLVNIDGIGVVRFPDDMSADQITSAIEKEIIPQFQAQQRPAQPSGGGSALGTALGSVVSGGGGLLSSIGAVGGMVLPGVGFDNALTRAGRDVQQYGESLMSEEMRAKRAALSEAVKQAEEQGLVAEASAALRTLAQNPSLIGSMLLEQIPMFVATGGIGRAAMGAVQLGTRGAVRAAAAGAERQAAAEAASQLAGRVGTGTAIGTGAAIQGGEVAGQAYQDIMSLPDATLANSPAYQALTQRMSGEEARRTLAEEAAQQAGLMGAGISGVAAAALPGAEKALFSRQLSERVVRRVLTGAAGEATQEAIEEGGGQIAQNIAARRADVERDITRGAAGAAAIGGTLGAIMGGGIAGVRGPQAPPAEARTGISQQIVNDYVAGRDLPPEVSAAAENLILSGEATVPPETTQAATPPPPEAAAQPPVTEAAPQSPVTQPVTPTEQTAAVTQPISAAQLPEMFGGMGRGIGEGLRNGLWEGYSQGTGAFRPERDIIVKAARDIADRRGREFTREEFDQFLTDFSKAKTPNEKADVANSYMAAQPVVPVEQPATEAAAPAQPTPDLSARQAAEQPQPTGEVAAPEGVNWKEELKKAKADERKAERVIKQTQNENTRVQYQARLEQAREARAKAEAGIKAQEDAAALEEQGRVRTAFKRAESIINKRLSEFEGMGNQGKSIADGIRDALANRGFDADQIMAAFTASDVLAKQLPGRANHQIKFMPKVMPTAEEMEAVRASGGDPNFEVQGKRDAAKGIIEISLNKKFFGPNAFMLRETSAHEAFHVLQDYYRQFDKGFDQALNGAFASGRELTDGKAMFADIIKDRSLKNKLQRLQSPVRGKSYFDMLVGDLPNPITPREAQAYVYGSLVDAVRRGSPITGVKPGFSRFINFLKDFFDRFSNAFKGAGYGTTAELLTREAQRGGSRFTQELARPTAAQVEMSARGAEPVLLRDINQLIEDAKSQSNWRNWYNRHEAKVNELFGDDAPLFKKILSATSQAASVPANVTLAIKAYKQLLNGEPFTGYLPAVIQNLERIRSDEGLRGRKISQYGQAVTADEAAAAQAVAVDRHIARLLFGVDVPTRRQVEVATQLITDIANRLGWEPRQVQAALWAFNQVRTGTDPNNVKSYDFYLNKRAEEIRAFRSSFSGAEGRSVQAGAGTAERTGKAKGVDIASASTEAIVKELSAVAPDIEFSARNGVFLKAGKPDVVEAGNNTQMFWDIEGGGIIFMNAYRRGDVFEIDAIAPEDIKKNPKLNLIPTGSYGPFGLRVPLGIRGTRKLVDDIIGYLKTRFPEIRYVEGYRITGTRQGLPPERQFVRKDIYREKPEVEFAARQSPLINDPNYSFYMDALTSQPIVRSGLFGGVFRRFVGAMDNTSLYGAPNTPERLRDALVRTSVNRNHPIWMLQQLAERQGVLNGRDIGIAAESALMNTGRMQILTEIAGLKFDPTTGDIEIRDDVKPLMEIFKGQVDTKNQDILQRYLIALREKDLRGVGRTGMRSIKGQPFTDQMINDIIQQTEQAHPEFVDIARDLKKFSDSLLDFAVDTGIMTRAKARELALIFYTPFYREMEADSQTDPNQILGPNVSNVLRNTTSALDKKLGGGDGNVGDLLENILRNADSILRAGLKNHALKMTAEVARDVGLGQVVQSPAGNNIVTYRVNGNEVHFRVDDPILFTAMATAPAKTRGALHQAMARMASFFREMITLAPSFMWANLYRGKFQAYAQEGASFSPFTTMKGMKDFLKANPSYLAFTAQTGFGGYTFGMGEKNIAAKMKKQLDDRGIFREVMRGNLLAPFTKAMDGLSRVSEATELAERLHLYEKLKAQGMTDKQAAFQAYMLAPFSRQGSGQGVFGNVVQGLIPLVPFLNAKIQGLYRLVENEKGNKTILKIPQQIFLRSMIITAFSTALYGLALSGGYDKELDDLTVDDIIRYDWIFTPNGGKFALPRNFEIGSFFGAVPILAMEAYRKGHTDDLTKAALSIGTSTLFFNPIPQGVLPILSATTNYDFFRGRELENYAMRNLPAEDRVDRSTTTIARLASAATGYLMSPLGKEAVSPIKMQAVLNGYLGSIGSGMMTGFDTILSKLDVIPNKPAGPFGDPTDIPAILGNMSGLGRFYRTDETKVSRFVGDFYELKEKATQVSNAIAEASRTGNFDRMIELQTEKGQLAGMNRMINRASTQLSELNRQIRMIEAGQFDSETKLALIAPLRQQRDMIARQTVQQARAIGAI